MGNLADRVLDSILPRPDPSTKLSMRSGGTVALGRHENKDRLPHTGTTILVFKYKDGIMFAADRKTTGGYLSIFSLDTIKIEQVAPYAAIGCAGLVADAQFVKEILEETSNGFSSQYGFPLSIEGQANYVSKLCRNFRFYIDPWSMGLEIRAVIGGRDFSGEFEIYEISGEGSLFKSNFTVIGSGTDYALPVLKDYRKDLIKGRLDLQESMMIAVKAIYRAGESDNGTSDIRVATPNIAVITKSGFELIKTKTVQKIVAKVLEKEA